MAGSSGPGASRPSPTPPGRLPATPSNYSAPTGSSESRDANQPAAGCSSTPPRTTAAAGAACASAASTQRSSANASPPGSTEVQQVTRAAVEGFTQCGQGGEPDGLGPA